MGNNNVIQYEYDALASGVSQMRNVNSNIDSEMRRLRSQVSELLSDFGGQSSQSYERCAQKINDDLRLSNDNLNTLSGNVNRSSNRMHQKDSDESRRFKY